MDYKLVRFILIKKSILGTLMLEVLGMDGNVEFLNYIYQNAEMGIKKFGPKECFLLMET